MMERNFYNDEFEQLIKEKTDQYKMYPSENVWKGIHGSLHTRKRWFIGTMLILIGGIILFAGKELIAPGNHAAPLKKIASTSPSTIKAAEDKPEDKPEDKESHLSAALSDFKTGSSHTQKNAGQLTGRLGDKVLAQAGSLDDAPTGPASDGSTTYEAADTRQSLLAPSNSQPGTQTGSQTNSSSNEQAGQQVGSQTGSTAISQPGSSGRTRAGMRVNGVDNGDKDTEAGDKEAAAKDMAAAESSTKSRTSNKKAASGKAAVTHLFSGIYYPAGFSLNGDFSSDQVLAGLGLPRLERATLHALAISIDKKQADKGLPIIPAAPAIDVVETGRNEENWLEEYAVNELIPAPKRRNRFALQLYLTPGFNYRSLSLASSYNSKTSVPNALLSRPQNGKTGDLLNQKPSPGFQAGGNLLYRINRNLTLKAGLQFSYIRYNVATSSAATPGTASNILNPGSYGYTVDSTNQAAGSMHNAAGKTPPALTNQYYQLGAPVGLELRILGGDRLQLNVAATIQPTYLFNTNSYVMTPDFNYAKNPSVFRRWNFNGAVEAFLSYKVGGLRWQIGPEFRYQLLSTYSSQYPIRENFREYGLKIGVSKTIW